MIATTAQAFSRVGGRSSSVKASAMSAVQPVRSETPGRALSMTARTSAGLGAWRDRGPAQLASRRRKTRCTPTHPNARGESQAGRSPFINDRCACAASGMAILSEAPPGRRVARNGLSSAARVAIAAWQRTEVTSLAPVTREVTDRVTTPVGSVDGRNFLHCTCSRSAGLPQRCRCARYRIPDGGETKRRRRRRPAAAERLHTGLRNRGRTDQSRSGEGGPPEEVRLYAPGGQPSDRPNVGKHRGPDGAAVGAGDDGREALRREGVVQ